MSRFKRQSIEKILLKGSVDYLRNEQASQAEKPTKKVMRCKIFLTDQRLVICKKRTWYGRVYGWGVLVAGVVAAGMRSQDAVPVFLIVFLICCLISFFIPRKIALEIPLHDLALVRYGEEKSSKELVFKSSDASEFSIRFTGALTSFGDTRDFWIKMITDAVKDAHPEIEVMPGETTAEFIQSR